MGIRDKNVNWIQKPYRFGNITSHPIKAHIKKEDSTNTITPVNFSFYSIFSLKVHVSKDYKGAIKNK